jgi:hypothetical protein
MQAFEAREAQRSARTNGTTDRLVAHMVYYRLRSI